MTKRQFWVREVFTHANRLCVVVELEGFENWARSFTEGDTSHSNYCNGYAQALNEENKSKDYDDIKGITADELTFAGTLDNLNDSRIPKDTYFFGFDSAHVWNDMNPESKTCKAVKQRTMKLAEELEAQNI